MDEQEGETDYGEDPPPQQEQEEHAGEDQAEEERIFGLPEEEEWVPPEEKEEQVAEADEALAKMESEEQAHQELEDWLYGLDGGNGTLMRYLEPLKQEFGNLFTVAACRVPKPLKSASSVIGCVDTMFFEALGVTSLGHRLLLAKGIVALADDQGA